MISEERGLPLAFVRVAARVTCRQREQLEPNLEKEVSLSLLTTEADLSIPQLLRAWAVAFPSSQGLLGLPSCGRTQGGHEAQASRVEPTVPPAAHSKQAAFLHP